MDVLDLFTHMDISVWEKIVRTLVVYLFILLVIRLAGRRMLAQMNALDLVVVLLLSNVVQNAIIGPDNSLLGGLVGAVVLVVGNAILDRLTYMFPNFGKLLDGRSAVVIKDGELDRAAMQRLSVTTDDLAFELGTPRGKHRKPGGRGGTNPRWAAEGRSDPWRGTRHQG